MARLKGEKAGWKKNTRKSAAKPVISGQIRAKEIKSQGQWEPLGDGTAQGAPAAVTLLETSTGFWISFLEKCK